MLRDPNKQEVTGEVSLKEEIEQRWKNVHRYIYDDPLFLRFLRLRDPLLFAKV